LRRHRAQTDQSLRNLAQLPLIELAEMRDSKFVRLDLDGLGPAEPH
jgi:hypothetical protein